MRDKKKEKKRVHVFQFFLRLKKNLENLYNYYPKYIILFQFNLSSLESVSLYWFIY